MKKSILLFTTLFACTAFSADQNFPTDDVEACYPKGLERQELAGFAATGISKEQFDEALAKVEKAYQPEFARMGWQLAVVKLWDNNQPNAAAMPHPQNPAVRGILMFGGLARHPEMTQDGFTMVACHEVGHHIGGAPKTNKRTWSASNEGQSDYFASLKCARKVFAGDNNVALMTGKRVPQLALDKCFASFDGAEERAICLRTTMAGLALAKVLRSLTQEAVDKQFPERGIKIPVPMVHTPDAREAAQTSHSHPLPQCRLDTMYQGAICPASAEQDLSQTNVETAACVRRTGDRDGVRPLCWYAPNDPSNNGSRSSFLNPSILVSQQ